MTNTLDQCDTDQTERTDMLFAQGLSAVGGGLVAAAIVMFLLWPQAGSNALIGWICLILTVSGLRLWLILGYRWIQPEPTARCRWYRGYLLSSLAIGVSWGLLSGVPTSTGSPAIQLLPSFAIAFVAMAAIPAYAPRIGSYLAFLGALTLTTSGGFYLTRSQDEFYLAALFPLLAMVLYSTASRFHRNLLETLQSRHAQDLLLNRMQETHAKLEATNSELRQKQDIIDQEAVIAQHVFQQLTVADEQQLSGVKTWTRALGSFSGDLIQSAQGPDDKQYLFLGDFTGHGLPAALGAVPATEVFRAMAHKGLPIEWIAQELNEKLYRLLPTGYFCCAVLMEINTREARIKIVNAGLPPVIAVDRAGNLMQQVQSDHLPLGIVISDADTFDWVEMGMRAEDCYYLYSDGVTEAENTAGAMWGETGLSRALQIPLNAQGRLGALEKALTTFMGEASISDDISMLEYRIGQIIPDSGHADAMQGQSSAA